ncbi:MAG: GyrI-like domain-containing protein [Candidatus Paracaedibacteraceae bacterium]|nr:GyrI-like domain-containing protein [Candidatus Paracaedibacteraceae bacterium]
MQKTNLKLHEITLLGISVQTSIQFEMSPITSKIGPCVQRFFIENLTSKMEKRKKAGSTFCVYTDYESDHMGPYTFFIGEEIESANDHYFVVPEGLEKRIIPAQEYAKFTTEAGPMPAVVIQAWQKIWQMKSEELGGKRSFKTDFQIHDERSANPISTILDLYVGVDPL